ncbi:MAG: anthranilate phosphoribosyltransferase [Microbacteriaceae bacterium]|nr:anthranilate phosphoribosyltransferase [Microbacteriaceae bacterium]
MPTQPTWPDILSTLLDGADLSIAEAAWAMEEVMAGRAGPASLGAFLVALRAKGETVGEIVGFRDAVLAHAQALPVDPMALDIVGTGGDRAGTVNVSTMASIVAAAAGARVVKHGNRAASSASGSSDVLGALGIDLTLPPERVAAVLDEVGITFAYAAMFHPGFKHAGPVRAELGIPTVFNFLGPLCNPARPEANALGVAQLDKVPLFVGVYQTRGASALVFRGDDGLDELSTTGHSHVWEVSRGEVHEHDLDPGDFGLPRASLDDLRGGDAPANAAIARGVLAGEEGPVRDIVLLNAAAGLVAWDLAHDAALADQDIRARFRTGISRAAEAIDSGAATAKLDAWAAAAGGAG